MDEIRIVNLADVPEHMPEISRWLWEEWARADGYSLEDVLYRTPAMPPGGTLSRRCWRRSAGIRR